MVFAVSVASSLEGGRAALLPPDRRRTLVREAAGMGLKPFDANVVIAMVQHAAREGEGVGVVAGVIPLMERRRAAAASARPSAGQGAVGEDTVAGEQAGARRVPFPPEVLTGPEGEPSRLRRLAVISLLIAAAMFAALRMVLIAR